MLVTELGMVTDVKPEQPLKALSPMLVTELGIVTDVKPVQPVKALALILVTWYVTVFMIKLDKILIVPEALDDVVTDATPEPSVYK